MGITEAYTVDRTFFCSLRGEEERVSIKPFHFAHKITCVKIPGGGGTSKYSKNCWYALLRWECWSTDRNNMWQSELETDLANESWHTWRIWLKRCFLLHLKDEKNVKSAWISDEAVTLLKWNKHKFHISVMFVIAFHPLLLHWLMTPGWTTSAICCSSRLANS